MTTTQDTATAAHAYLIDDMFACSGCVSADARDALSAQPVQRHDIYRNLRPVTACCGGRVVRHASDDYVVLDA